MEFSNLPLDYFLFQFHKGTIRTLPKCSRLTIVVYFNSIKVRLERSGDSDEYIVREFQFHKGTIRTSLQMSFSLEYMNFNSIKVRLEHETIYLNV